MVANAMTAEHLRMRGNELYKASKLEEAISLYRQAAELASTDPAPLSNLSAAYFELGDYASSIGASDRAIALLGDEAKKQKLLLRKAKAQVHSFDFENAEVTVGELLPSKEKTEIEQCVSTQLRPKHAERKAIHKKIIFDLPRYKPQIRTEPEYFPFGHDVPESLYDTALAQSARKKVALMFGGIGDGRHLLASLATIRAEEGMGKIEDGKCSFHFTIVDHKPAVIARNIIMLLILGELAECINDGKEHVKRGLIPCLYYLFLAPVMPANMYTVLQRKIKEAIEVLEGKRPMPALLDVPSTFRSEPLRVLQEWRNEVQEKFPASKVRQKVVSARVTADMQQEMQMSKYMSDTRVPPPEGCEKQEMFYRKTALLLMSPEGKGHSQEILEAYQSFDMKKPGALKKDFLKTVDESWKTNVTMIDPDWERGRETNQFSDIDETDLAHDPFMFGDALQDGGFTIAEPKGGLLAMLNIYFFAAGEAISHLKDRLRIEACLGDVFSVLEQIKYGLVGHREMKTPIDAGIDDAPTSVPGEATAGDSIEVYPKVYDKIHLSNIPDYAGGSLTTLLYAVPVIHPSKTSLVTSNCLRNPPRFKTFAHYNCEYLVLSNTADIKKTFEAELEDLDEFDKTNPVVLTQYMKWHHTSIVRQSSNLMPRQQLETWLYRLFFKIAIPKDRTPREWTLIYSPLNMTTFLRLCGHLHNLGYPAHWLSGVLIEICSGKVTTKARPPRTEPLQIKEVKKDLPALAQSTKPFVAELTTLLSLWQPILPFGILHPVDPIEEVHEYSVTFDDVDDTVTTTPSFALVLFSARFLSPEVSDLRQFILDDELANTSEKSKQIKENMHIMTTWNWNWPKKTATFWLRKKVFDGVRGNGDWAITIWRTDVWTHQAMPQPIAQVKDLGPFWTG